MADELDDDLSDLAVDDDLADLAIPGPGSGDVAPPPPNRMAGFRPSRIAHPEAPEPEEPPVPIDEARQQFKDRHAPQGWGEAVGRVALGAVPGIGAGMNADKIDAAKQQHPIPAAVADMIVKALPFLLSKGKGGAPATAAIAGAQGATEGYRAGGAMGALEGGASGAAMGGALRALGGVAGTGIAAKAARLSPAAAGVGFGGAQLAEGIASRDAYNIAQGGLGLVAPPSLRRATRGTRRAQEIEPERIKALADTRAAAQEHADVAGQKQAAQMTAAEKDVNAQNAGTERQNVARTAAADAAAKQAQEASGEAADSAASVEAARAALHRNAEAQIAGLHRVAELADEPLPPELAGRMKAAAQNLLATREEVVGGGGRFDKLGEYELLVRDPEAWGKQWLARNAAAAGERATAPDLSKSPGRNDPGLILPKRAPLDLGDSTPEQRKAALDRKVAEWLAAGRANVRTDLDTARANRRDVASTPGKQWARETRKPLGGALTKPLAHMAGRAIGPVGLELSARAPDRVVTPSLTRHDVPDKFTGTPTSRYATPERAHAVYEDAQRHLNRGSMSLPRAAATKSGAAVTNLNALVAQWIREQQEEDARRTPRPAELPR